MKTMIYWKCNCGKEGHTQEGYYVRCDCGLAFKIIEVYGKIKKK